MKDLGQDDEAADEPSPSKKLSETYIAERYSTSLCL